MIDSRVCANPTVHGPGIEATSARLAAERISPSLEQSANPSPSGPRCRRVAAIPASDRAETPMGVSARSLAGMAATLRHRGPDGEGFALCSREGEIRSAASLADVASMPGPCTVGFAHTRLSIIDLSHASDQPMLDPEIRHALVYNGEIYNYLELRRALIERGHRFSTAGDTEVVLRAYIEWGERCVERFVGMWAF